MYQFPSTLQLHIDREDRRIKELTEGILYDFLPAALSIMVPEATEVKLECCQVWWAESTPAVSMLTHQPLSPTQKGCGRRCAMYCMPDECSTRIFGVFMLRTMEQPCRNVPKVMHDSLSR